MMGLGKDAGTKWMMGLGKDAGTRFSLPNPNPISIC